MSDDRFRPLIHFTPPTGWMNDPNGLVYFEGEYHLFYQYLTPRHWGHAVSPDLVHWTHLPIALYPDDLGAIWSGSVVVDRDDTSGFFGGRPGLVALFTHCNERTPPAGPQMQSLAYSADLGRTWTMYRHNPVIPNPGVADFRDPNVFWHAGTQRWVMVIAFNKDRVHFYTSPNLRDWTWASAFGVGQGAHDGTWECPDLFALPVDGDANRTTWILHVSVLHGRKPDAHRHEMQYFIGDFDGTTFTNDNPADVTLWSDYGRDNYAAVSWSDVPPSDGRRLWIGWMNHWMYARRVPTGPWQGAMTLPRRLQLARRPAGVRLIQTPITELTRLRGPATRQGEVMITPTLPLRVPGTGEVFEVELEVRAATATACGVRVRHGAEHHTTIAYDVAASTLVVDRAHAGQTAFNPAFAAAQEAPLTPRPETLALHLFVDRSSVEVFADAGDVVITSLIFPAARTTDLEVYAVGGEAQVRALTVYPLDTGGTSGLVGATDGDVVVALPPAGDRVGREG